MPTPRSTLAFVVLPLALAAAPWTADLGFQPPEDSKAAREYSVQFEFELGDLTLIADGNDMSEAVPGDLDGEGKFTLVTNDRFVHSGGGRALELIRTFTTFETSMEAGGESADEFGTHDLQGKTVRFLWNEDESDYDVAYHDCEGDEEDLRGLGADMDLSALLPGRAVEVGDTWTVEPEKLGSVLLFGSRLEGGDTDELSQAFERELLPQLEAMLAEFEIGCTYQGERDEGGAQVGVIAVTLVGEGELDLEPMILAAIQAQDLPVEVDISFENATLSMSFEGKGELLWNVKGGILHAFDMNADAELVADVSLSVDAEGESHEMQAEAELLGRGTWKVRTPAGD